MRNRRKLRRYIITYDIVMTVLALISIGLVIFDLVGLISIGRRPFRVIDQSITLIFAIDYAIRFSLAPRKRIFVKTHVLDLLAIIPYNEVFTFLRFSRVGRFARLAKLSRLIGLSSKLKHISNRINRRNGPIAKTIDGQVEQIDISHVGTKTSSARINAHFVSSDGQTYDIHLINGDKRIANYMRHHKSESYTAILSFDKHGKPVYISKFWE